MSFRALYIVGFGLLGSGVVAVAVGRALAVRDQARTIAHSCHPAGTRTPLLVVPPAGPEREQLLDMFDLARDAERVAGLTDDEFAAAVARLGQTMGEQQ